MRSRGSTYGELPPDLLLRTEVFQDLCPGRTLRLSISGGFFSSVELGLPSSFSISPLPAGQGQRLPTPGSSPSPALRTCVQSPACPLPATAPTWLSSSLCFAHDSATQRSLLPPMQDASEGCPWPPVGAGQAPSRVAHPVLTQGQHVDGGEPCGTREELLLSQS